MAFELCYTSAPRGLYPGTSGFCTVKATQGIPLPLRELLESLSHYRHIFPPNHPRSKWNPVNYSSVTATVGGKRWQIYSRLQDCGVDHTQRSNFFAHHLALEAGEARNCCPTRLLAEPGMFCENWDGRVEELSSPPALSSLAESLRICNSWQAAAGDAGWAGAVAERMETRGKTYIAYQAGTQLLPLISEVLGLLSERRQREATFSTYFNGASQVTECRLRCVVVGSEEHRAANDAGSFVIDLTSHLGEPPPGTLVDVARIGTLDSKGGTSSQPPSAALPPAITPCFETEAESEMVMAPPVAIGALPPEALSETRVAASGRRTNTQNRTRSAAIWALPVGLLAGIGLACAVLLPLGYFAYRHVDDEKQTQVVMIAKLRKEFSELRERTEGVGVQTPLTPEALNAKDQEIANLKSLVTTTKSMSESHIENAKLLRIKLDEANADLIKVRDELAKVKEVKPTSPDKPENVIEPKAPPVGPERTEVVSETPTTSPVPRPATGERLSEWRTRIKLTSLSKLPTQILLKSHDTRLELSRKGNNKDSRDYEIRFGKERVLIAVLEVVSPPKAECVVYFRWQIAEAMKKDEGQMDEIRRELLASTIEFLDSDEKPIIVLPLSSESKR